MPKPSSGESKADFMARCVSAVVDEGKPQKQAVAQCLNTWEQHALKKEGNMDDKQKLEKGFYINYEGKNFSLSFYVGNLAEGIAETTEELMEVVGSLRGITKSVADGDISIIANDEGDNRVDIELVEKSWDVPIVKADAEQRLVYGVVLKPDVFDSQGDRISEEEIEKAAHKFMRDYRAMDFQHVETLDKNEAVPVESYISPVDMQIGEHVITKGSWVMATHIPDPTIWELMKTGKIRSYSIRGYGRKIEV